MKALLLLLLFPLVSFGQKDASENPPKPDLAKISYDDVIWRKAEGGSFWFFYKPTKYFFKPEEFKTISLDNGDLLVYMVEPAIYLLLGDFNKSPVNIDQHVSLGSIRNCIFIRRSRGGFWIYDKGDYVDHLERLGADTEHHTVIWRCGRTDKRYFINENDFAFAPLSRPVGILSE